MTEVTPTVEREIDVRGLSCPLPILHVKRALAEMRSGERLRVLATDRGTLKDFPAFAQRSGNHLESSGESDAGLLFVIRRR